MKLGKRVIGYIVCMVLGIVLVGAERFGAVDEFWSGLGVGLIFVSALRLVWLYRFRKDEAFREKVETEVADERNRFLRGRAWGWAGYLFILIAAVGAVAFRVMGQKVLCLAASGAVCLLMVLYWVAYLLLRRKY